MGAYLKSPALVGALSSLFFVTLNVAMNIYMKWLFAKEGGDFALPWTMLAVQQLQAYICLQPFICKRDPSGTGGWSFSRPDAQNNLSDDVVPLESYHKPLELLHLFQVLVVTLLFCLNVGLNSLSLVEISITLNQTVRAFLPVGVLLLASCIEKRAYPVHSYVTTAILVVGIGLTCWGSPDFHWHGFLLAFISTWVAAAGTSLNGFLLSNGPFSKGGPYGIARLMMIQSVPAFVIFGLIAWLTERDALVEKLMDTSSRWQWYHRLMLVSVSSALALLSNLGRCFLVAATSALMETFAGNAKVAALCIIDHQLFGTALFFYNYVGITLTFGGFSIHVLMQYAMKEQKEERTSDDGHRSSMKMEGSNSLGGAGAGVDLDDAEVPLTLLGKAWARPRLVSAADTGLVCEHVALEMGREHSRKRAPSESSASTFTGEHRPRAMTWQQGVNPLLQPETTAASWVSMNLEWDQIWEAPSLSWLNGDRSRVASANSPEECNPLTLPSSPSAGGSSGRSRFWTDQVHDRTPKSRREEASTSAMPYMDDSIGHLASVAEEPENEESVEEVVSRPRANSAGAGYDSESDDAQQEDPKASVRAACPPGIGTGTARVVEAGLGEACPPSNEHMSASLSLPAMKDEIRLEVLGSDPKLHDEGRQSASFIGGSPGSSSPSGASPKEIAEAQRDLPPMDVGWL